MRQTTDQQARRATTLLVIFSTAAFMTALDVFIVNVGLREIGRELHATSLGDLSWTLNAYAIVFAALLLPAGRLGDRYGNKAVFVVGLATFSLASLGCALSGGLWLIVGLRCVQAAGAAALMPTSVGLILTTLPPERRQRSVRVWAVIGSLGAAVGPALGGLLVALSWRAIFLLNVPVGLAALVAAVKLVPDVKQNRETRLPDPLGGVLLTVAAGTLVLALVRGPAWGWDSRSSLTCFAASALGALLFAIHSARSPAPLIDPGLFRSAVFRRATAATFLINLAFGMQLLGLILWMQQGWGWSALHTGLLVAPAPAMVSVTALGLRRLTAATTPGAVACVGSLLMACGGVLIGFSLDAHPNYLSEVLPGWLIMGAGAGLALPTILVAGTSELPATEASTGSAVLQMARWIGTAIGVALLVIVLRSSVLSAGSLDRFTDAWLWAGLAASLAAVAALGITTRSGRPATREHRARFSFRRSSAT